jgi:hypothetical protein
MGRFFKLPKRCPYCAHKLNKLGQCKNPNCIIGYVPDKKKAMSMAAKETTTENANEERMESTERESMTTTTSEDA